MDKYETTLSEVYERLLNGVYYDDYDFASGPGLRAVRRAADAEDFDYMAEADKTCSVIFGSQNVTMANFVKVLRQYIELSNVMNLYKKLLFRGKLPHELGMPVPESVNSLAVAWPANLDADTINVIHGIVGVMTEAGEAGEIMLAMLESKSGQSFDAVNVMEECGDLRWYIARMLRGVHATDDQCERMNIDKLHGRHGDTFDAWRDANRDLGAERAKLEAAAPLFDHNLNPCESTDIHRPPEPGLVWIDGCWRKPRTPIGDMEGMNC